MPLPAQGRAGREDFSGVVQHRHRNPVAPHQLHQALQRQTVFLRHHHQARGSAVDLPFQQGIEAASFGTERLRLGSQGWPLPQAGQPFLGTRIGPRLGTGGRLRQKKGGVVQTSMAAETGCVGEQLGKGGS